MGKHEQPGKSDEWYTPKYVFDALDCEFDVDVAAPMDLQHVSVPATRFIHLNSLNDHCKWNGFVWMNPPFGGRNGMVPWIDKFVKHGNGICFSVDRTSTDWWQDFAEQCDAVLFVRGKIKMIRPDGTKGNGPGNGTALFAIGHKAISALEKAERNGLGKLYYNHKTDSK